MDRFSVVFLVNILFLVLSLRVNLVELLKVAVFNSWSELWRPRRILLFRHSIVAFLVVVVISVLLVYNLVRITWIWIYSNPKNKEQNEQELLKTMLPDSAEPVGEPTIAPDRTVEPEEVRRVLIRKIKLFEYLEAESISKITSLFTEITLGHGEEITLTQNNGLFLLTQGCASVHKQRQVAESVNSGGFMKNMRAGDLIGDLFKLLHFVLNGNVDRYVEEYSLRIVVDSDQAKFLRFSFDNFVNSKFTLIQVVLSRFQKTTFDTMYKYLKISVPFVSLEFDFAHHYYDHELSGSFLQSVTNPADDTVPLSTEQKHRLLENNLDVCERIIEISNYYFSYLFLSSQNASSPVSPNQSTFNLNELIQESNQNISNISVRSLVELFELKAVSNCHETTKIMYFPKGTKMLAEGKKIPGVFLVLEGAVNIESGDGKRTHTLASGRFIGIPTVLVMETCCFNATASLDTIAAFFPFETVRMIFDSAKNSYISFVKKFLKFTPQVLKIADVLIDWKFYSAGQRILREGDTIRKIGLVIHGRLRALTTTKTKFSLQNVQVRDYTVGESFWEIECLTNESLGADFHAVRDTEVSFLSLESIGYISSVCPHIPFLISKIVAEKAAYHRKFQTVSQKVIEKPFLPTANIKTISLIPATQEIPVCEFGTLFYREMQSFDSCKMISSEKVFETLGINSFNNLGQLKLQRWLQEIEERFRIVIFIGDSEMSIWNSWIIKQSDCIFLVANALCSKAGYFNETDKVLQRKSTARRELILLHPFNYANHHADMTSRWLENRPWLVNQHHIYFPSLVIPPETLRKEMQAHEGNIFGTIRKSLAKKYPSLATTDPFLKSSPSDDIRRLCRIILGRSLGLVLGGGGAKGMAHIGVIRALEENGIKPDLIGGTSMGAYIAACYAKNPTYLSLYAPAKIFYDRMNSTWRRIMDVTFPYISIFTGHSFNRAIWEIYQDMKIEDLWLNFFCVTTNLTRSRLEIHQKGYLWRFVRATMSLAGYLPPLVENGEMLVDGGYLNNLPADVMQQLGAELVIAVDVGAQSDNSPVDIGDAISGWSILFKKLFGFRINVPSMGDIQARLTYVSGDQRNQEVLSMENCIYLRPPIEKYSTMGFKHSLAIIETGYQYAIEQIKKWKIDGTIDRLSHCTATTSGPTRLAKNETKIQKESLN